MTTSRRRFLTITALGATSLLTGCGRTPGTGGLDGGDDVGAADLDAGTPDGGADDAGTPDAGVLPDLPEAIARSAAGFPLGVASGDADPTRVVVWTKYAGAAPLRLRVWRMDGDVYAERVADVLVQPADGGFTHLDADGLTPGLRYRFAFLEEDGQGAVVSRSGMGRFRAALAPGAKEPLSFGAMSCSKQGFIPTPLQRAGERSDLDVFLLLGDTTYNDGANTLAEFRAKWAENLSRAEFKALLASTSVLATWDDHEITNNLNPETINAAKLAAATRAFFETLPLRRDAVAPDRVWKSRRWGDTVEFFVLDVRTERKPSTLLNAQPHTFISRAQLDWLKAGLKASTAVFKVVLTSVPISNFGFSAFNTDGWIVYSQQRTELLSWVDDESILGVLWLAGDHHFASVGTVSPFGPGSRAIEVLAGPAAQSGNPLHRLLQPPRWPFADDKDNYLAVHLTPATGEARLVFHDAADAVLFEKTYRLA